MNKVFVEGVKRLVQIILERFKSLKTMYNQWAEYMYRKGTVEISLSSRQGWKSWF